MATPTPEPAVLVGAGDIATCPGTADEETAKLLDEIEGTVFTLGDNAYPLGSWEDFANCYHPSWGRHRDRTRPSAGNHEYLTEDADPYFVYFGVAAGDPNRGYYSYELGPWLIIVLNSNCSVVSCEADDAQAEWLQERLEEIEHDCTLAYWHHARFSSGEHGNDWNMQVFWEILYDAGADVVVQGHDHHYERFMPLNDDGEPDPENGIRSFVAGTGGGRLRPLERTEPGSEVSQATTHGVLKFELYDDEYTWEFIPIERETFTDSGDGECH
jgi:acid phosphatase type 7